MSALREWTRGEVFDDFRVPHAIDDGSCQCVHFMASDTVSSLDSELIFGEVTAAEDSTRVSRERIHASAPQLAQDDVPQLWTPDVDFDRPRVVSRIRIPLTGMAVHLDLSGVHSVREGGDVELIDDVLEELLVVPGRLLLSGRLGNTHDDESLRFGLQCRSLSLHSKSSRESSFLRREMGRGVVRRGYGRRAGSGLQLFNDFSQCRHLRMIALSENLQYLRWAELATLPRPSPIDFAPSEDSPRFLRVFVTKFFRNTLE